MKKPAKNKRGGAGQPISVAQRFRDEDFSNLVSQLPDVAKMQLAAWEAAHEVVRLIGGADREPEYLRVAEVARRIRWSPGAFATRVSEGYFGIAEGVCWVGRRHVLIHWPTFRSVVLSGIWNPQVSVRWKGRGLRAPYRRLGMSAAIIDRIAKAIGEELAEKLIVECGGTEILSQLSPANPLLPAIWECIGEDATEKLRAAFSGTFAIPARLDDARIRRRTAELHAYGVGAPEIALMLGEDRHHHLHDPSPVFLIVAALLEDKREG